MVSTVQFSHTLIYFSFKFQQPVLSPECPVFQYHSHIHFPVEWAHMWGTFRFEKHNGTSLDVKIPSFPLYDPTSYSNSSNENLG